MKKLEYSHIARRKVKALRARLTIEYGVTVSNRIVKQIVDAIRGLEIFEEKGMAISYMYEIECDYRYFYVAHNYVFYRIEDDKVIVIEIFDEREDFMYRLFGITTTTQDSDDYWDE